MYYEAMPSESVLSYKGVDIYAVYKNDAGGIQRQYSFGTDPMVTDEEYGYDSETSRFDIRDGLKQSIPHGARHLIKPYRYDPAKTTQENLKELIDLGGIDYSNGRDVFYNGYGKITISEEEIDDEKRYEFSVTDKKTGKTETFNSERDMLYHLGYFGIKMWNTDDIRNVLEMEASDELGRDLSPAEEKRISEIAQDTAVNFAYLGGISCLEDCTDAEWSGLLFETKRIVGDDWVEKIADKKEKKKEKTR